MTRPYIWAADVFAFLTRKTIICNGRTVKGASMRNGICSNQRAIIVSDNGKKYESYPTLAHEIAHTMGVPHDGEGSSQGCPASQLFLMSPKASRNRKLTFSSCSKEAINKFLKTKNASCLFDYLMPPEDPKIRKRRESNCAELKEESEYYYVREGLNNCKYSCLFVNNDTNSATREISKVEENGTLCNVSNPAQKCKDGQCVQEKIVVSENTVQNELL
nr:venom metalloproteinase antarease-like TpachMP_B [Rhipicephalus microplus]